MLKDFQTPSRYVHDEYLRRHGSHPEPLEQPRHGLRQAIGLRLIHLGERLAEVDPRPVNEAA